MLHGMQKIVIIVPCFNESARMPVAEFESFIDERPDLGFCFVNDGSSDRTGAMLRRIADGRDNHVEVIDQPSNTGKAEAVRSGILHVLEQPDVGYVGYWDADLATPLDELARFIKTARSRPATRFISGSRIRRLGSTIRRRVHRHYLGRVFATLASLTLGMAVYDTQCGAKLIESGLAGKIFADPFISSWLFDVELLARTRNELGLEQTLETAIEIPLTEWEDKVGSNVKAGVFLKAPWELFRIYRKYSR